MATAIDDLKNASPIKITGSDEAQVADVQLIDGAPSLRTFGIQAIESLRGFDPIADVWFYIGTEENSSGAGAAGDTIRVQIAATLDNPTDFPAVDVTYTLISADAGDEEVLAVNLASYLNSQPSFSTLWRAQRISGSGVIYITARKPGGQYERPNTNDFIVTSTGTTVVTRAFDKIIRRNKITSLARDPADPRQGILGITGSVVQSEGDVTSRFTTLFQNLLVNGSVTPVVFEVPAHATEVRFISKVVFGGRGSGIQFGKFLSQSGTGLTNGILISYKSNDFSGQLEPVKTTDDFVDFVAGDPDNFALYIQSGGDKFIATLEFNVPLELRPQGEFASNDYFRITIRDNLTSGVTSLRAAATGFNREF